MFKVCGWDISSKRWRRTILAFPKILSGAGCQASKKGYLYWNNKEVQITQTEGYI